MTSPEPGVNINMSGIPVSGIGGLGLVAVAVLIAYVQPQAWWLMAIGAIGGVGLGAGLVLFRRVHRSRRPSGSDPAILFRAEAPVGRSRENRPADWKLRGLEPRAQNS
jgi:hypothetical protein